MQRRIDALPKHHPGIQKLTGAVLADALDPELQKLSAETSRELAAPIALLTLLLEHTQLIRAHHGLPPALEAALATDRDVSFCQFVVRDRAMFEVNDAVNDARVPQQLVSDYGIASYLGAPLFLDGEAVGALCVCDSKPRKFTTSERDTLLRLAALATRRLEVLAAEPRKRERVLHDRAVRPAFSELRNRLTPVMGNVSLMQVAVTELAAAQRLARYAVQTGDTAALGLLTRAAESIAELQECIDELVTDTQAIAHSIIAIERASTTSVACTLGDVLDAATTLAHHRTKLVGGVRMPAFAPCKLQTPRPVAINALSAALSELAESIADDRTPSGISLDVVSGATTVRVELRTRTDEVTIALVVDHLQLLLTDTLVTVESIGNGLALVFPVAADVAPALASVANG